MSDYFESLVRSANRDIARNASYRVSAEDAQRMHRQRVDLAKRILPKVISVMPDGGDARLIYSSPEIDSLGEQEDAILSEINNPPRRYRFGLGSYHYPKPPSTRGRRIAESIAATRNFRLGGIEDARKKLVDANSFPAWDMRSSYEVMGDYDKRSVHLYLAREVLHVSGRFPVRPGYEVYYASPQEGIVNDQPDAVLKGLANLVARHNLPVEF